MTESDRRNKIKNMSYPELLDFTEILMIENIRLTEQAERQLEIINKMKFLDLFKDKQ